MSISRVSRRLAAGAVLVGVVAATVGAAPAAFAGGPPERGTVVSATPIARLTVPEVVATLDGIGWPSSPVRYTVDDYRVVYRTVDTKGAPTTASALVVLPEGVPGRLPVVLYDHGTQAYRYGVASTVAGNGDRELSQYAAAAGFATVAPDYLGLGVGPGFHPYMDPGTEVSASIDAVRAARAFAARSGRPLSPRLMVTGFSQGAQATMAIGKALAGGDDSVGRVVALAPISGPYAIHDVEIPAMFDGRISGPTAAFYMAYWTVAVNRRYPLYERPAQVFNAPYDKTVEGLFDGYHDDDVIQKALPTSLDALFTPEYLARLRAPSGALLAAMRSQDGTCDWSPRVPVRLYAGSADGDAPIGNAYQCQARLLAHGARVPLVNVGPVDHTGSAIASAPRILDWFLSLR